MACHTSTPRLPSNFVSVFLILVFLGRKVLETVVILTPVLPDVFVLVVVRLNRQSVPGARVEASSDALISRLLHSRSASPLERVLLVALLLLGC